MQWYTVIKTINGRRYRYRQKTWREGGRVRTRSEYISREVIIGYHGTFAKFERFSAEHLGSATDCDSSREGFFFASNPKVAASYASTQLARERSLRAKIRMIEVRIETITGVEFSEARDAFDFNEFDVQCANKLRNFFRMRERAYIRLSTHRITKVTVSKRAEVKKCVLDMENPYIYDMGGRRYNETEFWEAAITAKDNGYDGVIIRKTYDPGSCFLDFALTDIYIVFSADKITPIGDQSCDIGKGSPSNTTDNTTCSSEGGG